MNRLNEPLEASNGTWAILAAYCVVFIGLHFYRTMIHEKKPLRLLLLPIGLQMALATGIICLAEVITRGAVWHWRFSTDGDPGQLIRYAYALGAASVIGNLAFLWVLRQVTRPMGIWPVAAAGVTVAAFWLTFLL